jgi:hypothetical protein
MYEQKFQLGKPAKTFDAIRKTSDVIFDLLIYYALYGKICLTFFRFREKKLRNREADINALFLFREKEIMEKN